MDFKELKRKKERDSSNEEFMDDAKKFFANADCIIVTGISPADFIKMKYNDDEAYESLKKDTRDYRNWSKADFPSERSLIGHYNKHSAEFGYSSAEAYISGARNLMRQPTSEKILGYETGGGRRVRYSLEKEAVVIGKKGKIITYFKPDEKEAHYYDDYRKELE